MRRREPLFRAIEGPGLFQVAVRDLEGSQGQADGQGDWLGLGVCKRRRLTAEASDGNLYKILQNLQRVMSASHLSSCP